MYSKKELGWKVDKLAREVELLKEGMEKKTKELCDAVVGELICPKCGEKMTWKTEVAHRGFCTFPRNRHKVTCSGCSFGVLGDSLKVCVDTLREIESKVTKKEEGETACIRVN